MDVALENAPGKGAAEGATRAGGTESAPISQAKGQSLKAGQRFGSIWRGDNLENSRSGCFLRGVPPVASGCAAPLFQSHTAVRGVVFLFAAKKKKGYGTKCQWINWLIW